MKKYILKQKKIVRRKKSLLNKPIQKLIYKKLFLLQLWKSSNKGDPNILYFLNQRVH